jgi:isopentenyldiphosphate isomerase
MGELSVEERAFRRAVDELGISGSHEEVARTFHEAGYQAALAAREPAEAEVETVAAVIRNVWLTDAEGIAAMECEAENIARDILSRLSRRAPSVEDVQAKELRAGDRVAHRVDQVLGGERITLVGVEVVTSLLPDQMVTRVR